MSKTKEYLKSCLRNFDYISGKLFLRILPENNSLLTFLFHGLFLSEKEMEQSLVDPQQKMTVEHFRKFVEYFLGCGYNFVSPVDILNGLDADKKYILVTFDDGYFNNQYALPVLGEYKVPAVFFIATNNVKHNKCFWWDVFYRESLKRGMKLKDIIREERKLKSKTAQEIEQLIIKRFGKDAFKPVSDVDRPFTPAELKVFAANKYVFLGNHTCDHAILTNYTLLEIKEQILHAQNDIFEFTGIKPVIISYPNGNYSKEVISISSELGLKLGITVKPKKNHLPLDFRKDSAVCLGRFILEGNKDMLKQCEIFRRYT